MLRMRLTSALAGAALFAMAQAAYAAPVTLAPISFSPELQAELDAELGAREGEVLQRAVSEAVARALTERGATLSDAAPVTVEISILDADPNRPTLQQLADRPGLDGISSVSIGGAELHAVLRGPDGQVLSEVSHRRYNYSITDVPVPSTTWSEARRAIRRFADKVADAYVANVR
jgi:hypothetical protein